MIYGTQFDPDNNVVYALVTDAGEPAQAYRIDLAAGTRTKLAGRDDVKFVKQFVKRIESFVP